MKMLIQRAYECGARALPTPPPPNRSTQLEVAVLYHLEGQLERAWQELALCAEQLPAEMEGTTTASHLAVLVERTRLQLAAES